jgi:hypothetical protein
VTATERRGRIAVAASLALIAAATLVPQAGGRWTHDFWCRECHASANAVEILANILLFVPLGLALSVARVRVWRAVGVVVATTIIVETLQYFVVAGREGSIRDCVTNALGGTLAYLSAPYLPTLWRPSPRAAWRLAWIACGVWIAFAAFTMFAFGTAMTRHRYYAGLGPELGQFDLFRGAVRQASINGAAVYSGPFPPGLDGATLAAESIELAASIVMGPAPARLAPIFWIGDSQSNEIALLGQRGNDLVFRTRTRGSDFGLPGPVIVAADMFSPQDTAGTASVVEGVRTGYQLSVSARWTRTPDRRVIATLRPALGWMLGWVFDPPRRTTIGWITWLWLALPMVVIGWWSARGGERRKVLSLAPAIVTIGGAHVLVPLAFHARPQVTAFDASALLAGTLIGLALGRLRRSGSPS